MNKQDKRAFLLYKLNRDWPALRIGMRNGRKLNRLSTKQLEAKVRACQRMTTNRSSIMRTIFDIFQDVLIASEELRRLLEDKAL